METDTGQLPHPEDFHSLFNGKIYQRAQAYYDAGTVRRVSQSIAGLWHAQVMGSNGFYDVDIRIRHGHVVSAACTCPYGQKHTYCKHVGAVLFALDAQNRQAEDKDSEYASSAASAYWNGQFPGRLLFKDGRGDPDARLTDEDWQAVRRILETACGLPDIETYLEYLDRQQLRREIEPNKSASTMNMRLLVPYIKPADISDLPHGWLTFLEAAYEHLHDTAGLRRLYIMYILMARTFPEAVYVRKLREVSGDHWAEDRTTIVDYVNGHKLYMMHGGSNPAYERLLREEHLPQAAYEYSLMQSADCRLRLFDLIAEANPEKTKQRVCGMLQQPESPIYQSNDQESADLVSAWLHCLDDAFGESLAHDLARHIVGMFPQRKLLHHASAEYLADPSPDKETSTSEMSSNAGGSNKTAESDNTGEEGDTDA